MRRLFAALALVAFLALAAAPLGAAPPSPENPAGRDHDILGAVHPRNEASKPGGASNLVYHNGPVMKTNRVYAIYWIPTGFTVSPNYKTVIDGFFGNVAAATTSSVNSDVTSNVYYANTQYYGAVEGPITNQSSFNVATDSVVDTAPFPLNGCTDSYTSVCLSDAQLTTEIQAVMQLKGWTPGPDKLYFLFTPKGVGSCSGTSCAFSQYCAYHSSFTFTDKTGVTTGTALYANQPYTSTVTAACDTGQHPNGDDADGTLNVVSHEHNEAITDPRGSAWFDRQGAENGDKCAWTFGTAQGTAGAQYNQVINGAKYYLQREWSNNSSACVLTGK